MARKENKSLKIIVTGEASPETRDVVYEAEFNYQMRRGVGDNVWSLLRRKDSFSFRDFGLDYEAEYTSQELLEKVEKAIRTNPNWGAYKRAAMSWEEGFD